MATEARVRGLFLLLCLMCAVALAWLAPARAAAGCPGWNVQKTISSPAGTVLYDVGVVPGSSQAWAVGSHGSRAAILHFDGRRWSSLPAPEPPTGDALDSQSLHAVHAVSPSDVWAVGSSSGYRQTYPDHSDTDRFREPLALHWDGVRWSSVPFPDMGLDDDSGAVLRDVIALASDDVWAVGTESWPMTRRSILAHWNGSTWTLAPNKNLEWNGLNAVARVPYSRTLWAVGGYVGEETGYGPERPLINQFKNGAWNWIGDSLATAPVGDTRLNDVEAVRWDDIWAIGTSGGSWDASGLIAHRSGAIWTLVPSPAAPPDDNQMRLTAISAVSATDIWTVGWTQHRSSTSDGPPHALFQHWDGTSWSTAHTPLDGKLARINAVAMRKSGWGWAVGYATTTTGHATAGLILRHCRA